MSCCRGSCAPYQPELALGAISEEGHVYINYPTAESAGELEDYLAEERRYQLHEIARRQRLLRAIRPQAVAAHRSVIVADDGIATGSTMIAALQAIRTHYPRELIVAVPVAAPDRLSEVRQWCDDTVCLLCTEELHSVGQFYRDFPPVEDQEVADLLRRATHAQAARLSRSAAPGPCGPTPAPPSFTCAD
jgi:predicted phosphoribosyltransferase